MSACRRSKRRDGEAPGAPVVRCAVYTRKSTEKGLEQEFNSLDAQRESAEAYIASQKHEGWVCLPDRYDDGGFSGGTMERPALRRLLDDVESGKVDVIVLYRLDRLSRSILDFARIAQILERRKVSFVSMSELINTSTSSGRLYLNVLMSFAQHERELISERTRDKMSAARRKGRWVGGMQILGYDLAPQGGQLVVNATEAERVREIFALYVQKKSLIAVAEELNRRGWRQKHWVTRRGHERGGGRFDKPRVLYLLKNHAYIGKVAYGGTVYPGQHEAIVDDDLWQGVQAIIRRNSVTAGGAFRNRQNALLKGLLRCLPCDAAMIPTYTSKKGSKRYSYYVCSQAQREGWAACPSKSVPAGEIERFIVDRLRVIGTDPALVEKVAEEAGAASATRVGDLERERKVVAREIRRGETEIRKLVEHLGAAEGDESPATARLADLQDRLRAAEERGRGIRRELAALEAEEVAPAELRAALEQFAPVWESLAPREQARLVELLIARVGYDGRRKTIALTFRPAGIRALAEGESP